MTNELFLFIILVLILLFFLPERKKQRPKSSTQTDNTSDLTGSTGSIGSEDYLTPEQKKYSKQKKLTMEVINDYLSETKCEEGFETLGPDMNIGNDMSFSSQQILPSNKLDKELLKSLVPDFEPSALNINSNLNSFGYATNNSQDNNFYLNRGFLNPTDASQFANSIQYNLAHPYQTRYCDK